MTNIKNHYIKIAKKIILCTRKGIKKLPFYFHFHIQIFDYNAHISTYNDINVCYGFMLSNIEQKILMLGCTFKSNHVSSM